MFAGKVAAVAVSAFTLVSAQSNSNSTWTIDPSTVDVGTRNTWCTGEYNACTALCTTVEKNDCDTDTLDFLCICEGGVYPDMNKYQTTMPFSVCEEDFTTCIADHPNDKDGQDKCKTDYDCPTTSIDDVTPIGSASSSPTPSPTSSAAPTGTDTTATTTSAQDGGNAGARATVMPAAAAAGLLAFLI